MQCLIVLDLKASRRRRPVQSTQTKTKQNKASYKYLVYRCDNWFSRIMHISSLVNTCTVSKDRPIWIAEHKLWSSGFKESQQVYLGHKNKFKFRAGFFSLFTYPLTQPTLSLVQSILVDLLILCKYLQGWKCA